MRGERPGLRVITVGLTLVVAIVIISVLGAYWYDHNNLAELYKLSEQCSKYTTAAQAFEAIAPTLPKKRFFIKRYELAIEIEYKGIFWSSTAISMFSEPTLRSPNP
jgi:hypothetical protein